MSTPPITQKNALLALASAASNAATVSALVTQPEQPCSSGVRISISANPPPVTGWIRCWVGKASIPPMMRILTPELQGCSGCVTKADTVAAFDAADANASKAFFWVMGGVDIRQGRLSIFGHYIITSSAKGFLLQGPTHTLQGGVRYSLGTAKEEVTQEH